MKNNSNGQKFPSRSGEAESPVSELTYKALEILAKKDFTEQVSYNSPFAKKFHSERAIYDAEEMMQRVNEQGFCNLYGLPFSDESEFLYAIECDYAGIYGNDGSIDEIQQFVGDCTRCKLCEARSKIVHSEGDSQARLMFIGEAPGKHEDEHGRPFFGPAGQLLSNIIESIRMKRDDVFIANVVRCRPPENRRPTLREITTCKQFLFHEISIVQPEVIVTLGSTATAALLGLGLPVDDLRGRFYEFQGIPVMPTYHPAFLLRDVSKKQHTWSDMKQVRAYLDGNK